MKLWPTIQTIATVFAFLFIAFIYVCLAGNAVMARKVDPVNIFLLFILLPVFVIGVISHARQKPTKPPKG